MKSVFKSAVMIAGFGFILCSCSKEGNYSCKCKINGDEITAQVYERSDKKEARRDCENYEKQSNHNVKYSDCKISGS